MIRQWVRIGLIHAWASVALVSVAPLPALRAEPGSVVETDAATEAALARQQARAAMVARIDALLAQRHAAEGVEPAPAASDSELVRRLYLDLAGVIPRVAEVRAFLDDRRGDKAERLVEALLASPRYATHMATTWRNRMLPADVQSRERSQVLGVQNWLRLHFAENTRFDGVVADLLVATDGNQLGPALYFLAHDLAPEKLAASTSELFLGMQLECAQCHDHPYTAWSQEDFWGYAAFFARVRQRESPVSMDYRLADASEGEVRLPGSGRAIPPKYLGGRSANADEGGTRRLQLAIWMASRDNPYLATATVNWAWSHLFGYGFVEPLGDAGDHNPPSHPELLEELSAYFAQTSFDFKELWRTLTRTQAYRLASQPPGSEAPPPHLFACMSYKALTPEQLYDSLIRASPSAGSENSQNAEARLIGTVLEPRREGFVERMRSPQALALEYTAGLQQALMLMNGEVMAAATTPDRSRLLKALAAPFWAEEDCVDVLYLATLSRFPRAAERQAALEYLESHESGVKRQQARSDLLWALLNSTEFAFNH